LAEFSVAVPLGGRAHDRELEVRTGDGRRPREKGN